MKNWVLIAVLVVILILVIKFVGITGLNVLLRLGDQGGVTRYGMEPVNNFVQCWDADPANMIAVKSVCHAQYLIDGKLQGMNAIDYCKSDTEVVDFFCGVDFSCQELVSECPQGQVCRLGQCTDKAPKLKLPSLSGVSSSVKKFFDGLR